jgi:hypothetical protein
MCFLLIKDKQALYEKIEVKIIVDGTCVDTAIITSDIIDNPFDHAELLGKKCRYDLNVYVTWDVMLLDKKEDTVNILSFYVCECIKEMLNTMFSLHYIDEDIFTEKIYELNVFDHMLRQRIFMISRKKTFLWYL